MRRIALLVLPLAVLAVPLAVPAVHAEIVDTCYQKDIVVRVRGVVCVGADKPTLPPSGG